MSARDERELRGVEIDIIELVELHASSVDAHEFASAEYVDALSFQNFKNTWRTRAFSNVHLGKLQQQTFDGLWATCVQHEIDHLNGKLFIDYLGAMKRQMITRKMQKLKREKARA